MKDLIIRWWQGLNHQLLRRHMGIAFMLVFLNETLYRHLMPRTLSWMVRFPWLAMMNIACITLVMGVMGIVARKKSLAPVAVSVVALFLGVINAEKLALRNVPLETGDALLIKEVWALRDALITNKLAVYAVIAILGILAISWGIHKIYVNVPAENLRRTNANLIVFSVLVLMTGQWAYNASMPLERTGFMYALSNASRVKPLISDNIINEAAQQVNSEIEAYQNDEESAVGFKPNVIVIMSEAFWDINKMGIEMTENPLPFFESLRNESTYGELYVPVIGGGTVNTEFEVMTGMTVKNYSNDWYMVYPNEINTPFPSMASILRNQGYEATALHPYMSWYYNRYEVYKNLGFNNFESLEFMGDTDKYGSFTQDAVTFDKLLELVDSTDAPLFNYTVTIQNHGPYGDARFTDDERTLSVETPLSDEATYFVNNYIQGLYYSDKALESFIDTLRASDEPTMVVFFGDHLPMLGNDYLAYRDSGYIGDETDGEVQQDLDMMSVPFIVWKNYDNTSKELPMMNASFLTPKILEWAGAELPNYLKATATLSDRLPIITRTYAIDSDGDKHASDSYPYLLGRAEYQVINDDLLDSSKQVAANEWLVTDNTAYNQDINDITISNIYQAGTDFRIEGKSFSPEMTLFVNNLQTPFEFLSDTEIKINAFECESADFQMQLDDKGIVTAVSNIYRLTATQ